MIEAGCYIMHIRCDKGHRLDDGLKEYNRAHAWEYTGRTEADCKRQAKAAGWIFKKDGKTYCPYCSDKSKAPAEQHRDITQSAGERWLQAFERMKSLESGTEMEALNTTYILEWVADDPHPPALWLKQKQGNKRMTYILRKGDPLMYVLKVKGCS